MSRTFTVTALIIACVFLACDSSSSSTEPTNAQHDVDTAHHADTPQHDADSHGPDTHEADTHEPDTHEPDTHEPDTHEPEACDAPMATCPEEFDQIFPGSPCVEGLVCEGPSDEFVALREAQCVDNAWEISVECLEMGGPCYIPPPAEPCMGVFEGQAPDASVALGPMGAGPFVPFEAGDMVNLVWGPQGSPMLEFRMQVDGHESENCYLHEVSAELSTGETAQGGGSVRARCGSTLTMYLIVPDTTIACDPSVFQLRLELMVQGIGTVSYELEITGGGAFWC